MALSTRPVVLPETYCGTANWDEWESQFENVAAVNGWSEEDKLKWLKVRLSGRAQTAFRRLPAASRANFSEALKALRLRFEPPSRKTRYQAELQHRRKKKDENWADLADDLRMIAEKAYPNLEDEAKETLALQAYLAQLSDPQVAFGVKQKTPKDLDEAVTATIELESYLVPRANVVSVTDATDYTADGTVGTESEATSTVSAISVTERLAGLVEKLTLRVEQLESAQQDRQATGSNRYLRGKYSRPARTVNGGERRYSRGEIVCFRCGIKGHIARECRRGPSYQGN